MIERENGKETKRQIKVTKREEENWGTCNLCKLFRKTSTERQIAIQKERQTHRNTQRDTERDRDTERERY